MSVEFINPPAGAPDTGSRTPTPPTQPFAYPLQREFVEPDWTRLPAYRDVTTEQWESAQWQRAHTVKNLKEFKAALGDHLDRRAVRRHRARPAGAGHDVDAHPPADDQHDGRDRPPGRPRPPVHGARLQRPRPEWPTHPLRLRDSLHEADMWAVEGLTHRYPTKVLAELIPTCPQYCGHCTRMDLVGNDTPQVLKYKFETKQNERWDAMLDYLRSTPQVRDVVVSGGDVANLPIKRLEDVRHGAARHREHPRHPPRHQGPDGHPAALPPGRRARGRAAGARRTSAASTSPSTRT